MESKEPPYLQRAIEISIRLIIVFIMIFFCFEILKPFITALLGGVILAVAAFPLFKFIQKKTKLSDTITAVMLTVFSLILIVLPCYLLMASLINEFHTISGELKGDKLGTIPPVIANLPIVGHSLSDTWTMASKNTPMLFSKYESQLHSLGTWLIAFVFGLGSGIVHLLLSIILAGIFLVYSKSGSAMAHKLFVRLAGENGDKFSHVAERTIQNVTKGIIGVSAIDAVLASIGFFIAGVPLAGVWTLVCFILCVVQIGVLPVAVPVVIYMFYTSSALTGILLGVWMIIIYVADHLMKPVLLGKGAPVPMPVIFIGVIGGFIAAGFVGMFLGAVVFSIAYNLFLVWLENSVDEVASKTELKE